MNEAQWQVLRPVVVRCGVVLFAAHGVPLEVVTKPPRPVTEQVAASVKFDGDRLHARLTLIIDYPLLISTHPGHSKVVSERELRGWSCELVNQLLGLLKAQLRLRGLLCRGGLPTCLIGTELSHVQAPGARMIHLRAAEHGVLIRLLCTLGSGVVLAEPQGDEVPPPGGVVLFS